MKRLQKHKTANRGQATIESVMGIMLLSLIFFSLVQMAHLFVAQMVANHAATVTMRSYVVGFEREIVLRASEVGTIPMAMRSDLMASGVVPMARAI